MKKLIYIFGLLSVSLVINAQIPDPCTGAGASQPINTASPCNCGEVNMVGGTPCNKTSFTNKPNADAAIHTFLTTQSTWAIPTTPVLWQDVRSSAMSLAGTFKHEFTTEVTTDVTTSKLNILNIAQVQINCNAVCQDYKIIQKTGTCGTSSLTPVLIASSLDPSVSYRQYSVLPNTTYIISRQLYFDGTDLDCYGTWVGGDGVSSLAAQITSQHWFFYEEGSTLPLKLVSFTGIIVNKQAQLQWVTANEVDIQNFEIETSTDGINFSKTGTVMALQGTNNVYSFKDINAVDLTFYRIKIIDKDGRFILSNIIKLSDKAGSHLLSLSPNPASDLVQINLFATNKSAGTVQVINMNGTLMSSSSYNLNNGINNLTLNVSGIPRGLYLVKICNGAETFNQKLMVQ